MKTIRGKILLWMSLTVAVALVVFGSVCLFLIYRSSNQMLEQTLEQTADLAAERVAQELAAYTNVAADAGAVARLTNPAQTVADKQEIIDQRVAAHGFMRGNIIGPDGVSIFDGKDYSDREYFQKAMQGKAHISEPLVSKITGELSIIVAAPLWEGGVPNTKVAGVVYFVPEESFLNDIVGSIKVSENGSAYMLDAMGTTIAHVNLENVKNKDNTIENAKTDPSLAPLAALSSKMVTGETGFGSYSYGGVKKCLAYAPVPGTNGWSIGINAPLMDFMGPTYSAALIVLALLLASLVATWLIARGLANGIGKPVSLCASRLQALAQGDLQTEVPTIARRDEIGTLAQATGTIVSTMRGIITDIDWGLREMATGNFKISSQAQELYVGDFRSLASSMYHIMESLTATLQKIDKSAEQVSAGSHQVAAGAQALSQGTTEQASSVEELAATISDISDHIKGTANNALEAREQTSRAGEAVAACSGQMREMMAAMEGISQKSAEIGKIIKSIEDIAFQTNILALNAAVEAARAGSAGKGFAVVADEVRNLASKSAEASKDTSALIEGSIEAVAKGTAIANETAASLSRVVESAQAASALVDSIASAASDQAASIAQVTQGVGQISAVVQTNSATAEQSAAASQELSGQAEMLKSLVQTFSLREE